METESKLLKIYSTSPFSKIGSKVTSIVTPKVPNSIKINEFDTKSILAIQKDFDEIVSIPFHTVLSELSDMGKIRINPTTPVLKLFSTLNDIITPIQISNDTNLLKVSSVFSNIKDATTTSILANDTLPVLGNAPTTSVLNETIPSVQLSSTTDKLLTSTTEVPNTFNTPSVLNFNSSFDDIIQLKMTSVLNEKSPFGVIHDFPYFNLLNLKSKFNDLILQNVGDVLKTYAMSSLPSSIPGDIDSFVQNASQGKSNYNFNTLVEHQNTASTPIKTTEGYKEMLSTPVKVSEGYKETTSTPVKNSEGYREIPATPIKTAEGYNEIKATPDKVSEGYREITATPVKISEGYREIPSTPVKIGEGHNDMPNTPVKNSEGYRESPATPVKAGEGHNDMPNTPVKNSEGYRELPNTPAKISEGYRDATATPEKFGLNVTDNMIVPNKILEATTPSSTDGFVLNARQGATLFDLSNLPKLGSIPPQILPITSEAATLVPIPATPDKTLEATDPTAIDGFVINADNIGTQYDLTKTPTVYGFNWNGPDNYPGVLNQYAVYFSKYPPLTDVSFKTVIDWAINRTTKVPEATALLAKGFHTPTTAIPNINYTTPTYQYADDRLPGWAKTTTSTLEDVGSTILSGFLSQTVLSGITSLLGVDVSIYPSSNISKNQSGTANVAPTPSALTQSPLAWHSLTGEIYWSYKGLGTVIRDATNSVVNFASGIVGQQVASNLATQAQNAIGGGVADIVNKTLGATILDSDKVLMLFQVLMGTKYTKSKAFFDILAKTYNSKYGDIGDNALNLYTDTSYYSKFISPDSSTSSILSNVPGVSAIESATNNILNSIQIPDSTLQHVLDSDNVVSKLKTLWEGVSTPGDYDKYIPIGNDPGLLNSYVKKFDSSTFGIHSDDKGNIISYDDPALTGSLDYNYPSDTELSKGAVRVKSDLNALTGSDTIADIIGADKTSLTAVTPGFGPKRVNTPNSYYVQLKDRLRATSKTKVTLSDRGFADSENAFIDEKNTRKMTQMHHDNVAGDYLGLEEFNDTDLIDFYFEDLSVLSGFHESVLIPFRAIITNISDGTSATWQAQDYMGRADKFYIYQGFERHIDLSFEVAINSKAEFVTSWQKINYLNGMCYPTAYPQDIALKAPVIALTVGNLFNRVIVVMNSFNISLDGGTLWEIQKGYQLPTYIKIQTAMTVIYADVPQASGNHYAQNQDWIQPNVYEYNDNESMEQVSNRNRIIRNDVIGTPLSTLPSENVNINQDLSPQTFNNQSPSQQTFNGVPINTDTTGVGGIA